MDGSELRVAVYLQVTSSPSPSPSHLLPSVAEPVRHLSFRLQRRLMTVQQRRAHSIDRLSRRLFPLSFVVFNVVYWLSYLLWPSLMWLPSLSSDDHVYYCWHLLQLINKGILWTVFTVLQWACTKELKHNKKPACYKKLGINRAMPQSIRITRWSWAV